MSRPHYDDQNIFARILRGEIPCTKVDECDHTLSFEDIQPQAPVHILVIPKGAYVDMADLPPMPLQRNRPHMLPHLAGWPSRPA